MEKLLNVKKKIGTLSKGSKNPFFKRAYLDLTDLLEAVEPLLHEEGLILLQPIENNCVCSQIWDAKESKLLVSSSMFIPEQITDPQKLGSAITYFRRYTLKSVLSIAEVDDDGNKASQRPNAMVKLENCKDLNELKDVYKSLSPNDQRKYLTLKDELKNKLS